MPVWLPMGSQVFWLPRQGNAAILTLVMSTFEDNGMLRTLSIHNFKCFDEFVFGALSQFNLITGENDTGKTALLEALFLHSGARNPACATNINFFRGMDKIIMSPDVLWGWHFQNHDISQPIELKGQRDKGVEDNLRISLQRSGSSAQELEGEAAGETDDMQTTSEGPGELYLAYEYDPPEGPTLRGSSRIRQQNSGGSLRVDIATKSDAKQEVSSHFLSARTRSFTADAQHLSNLIAGKKKQAVLDAIHVLDKRVKDLSVQFAGGEPFTVADIDLPEMVPLPFAGEGLTRFLSMVIRVLRMPKGLLLIDEIENGLHHTVLQRIFGALMDLAKQHQVQVVATTHSRECVKAFYEASISFTKPELALFRLERRNGKRRLVRYDEASLEAAMDAEFEVR